MTRKSETPCIRNPQPTVRSLNQAKGHQRKGRHPALKATIKYF